MNRKGFTLVELLVVLVIVAILASVIVVGFNGVQSKSRDSKRKSDLQSISTAIAMYKANTKTVPASDKWIETKPGAQVTLGYVLQNQLVPNYIPKLPCDPKLSGSTCDAGFDSTSIKYGYIYYGKFEYKDIFAPKAGSGCTELILQPTSNRTNHFSLYASLENPQQADLDTIKDGCNYDFGVKNYINDQNADYNLNYRVGE